MPLSTKVVGGCSVTSVVFALVIIILGIVVMTSSIPTSNCGGDQSLMWGQSIGVTKEESEDMDAALFWIGLPLIVGGIVSVIGGAFGTASGFKPQFSSTICGPKCCFCVEASLLGTGGGFMVLACLVSLFMASVFAHLCEDYKCDTTTCADHALVCQNADVCCECDGVMSHASCKESIDWSCDMVDKKSTAMAFALIGAITSIVTSACGCGAGCCCPGFFPELAALEMEASAGASPAVIGMPVVGQPVYGQPCAAGNEAGNAVGDPPEKTV